MIQFIRTNGEIVQPPGYMPKSGTAKKGGTKSETAFKSEPKADKAPAEEFVLEPNE